ENDHPVKVGAQPLDDLPDTRTLLAALIRAQGGIGRKQDAFHQPDGRALAEARKRRDEQALHAERGPVALRVLDQLVGFAHPYVAVPALEPIVQQDARDLTALTGARAIAEKPAAAKADGVRDVIASGSDEVEGVVDRPRTA